VTARLLPPAGAQPGSEWLLLGPIRERALAGAWTGERWLGMHAYRQLTPEEAAATGWRLADPHGAGAALQLFADAGLRMPGLEQWPDGEWYASGLAGGGILPTDAFSGSGRSGLAAAQAAIAEWRRGRRER
jgi:hypothetical protein